MGVWQGLSERINCCVFTRCRSCHSHCSLSRGCDPTGCASSGGHPAGRHAAGGHPAGRHGPGRLVAGRLVPAGASLAGAGRGRLLNEVTAAVRARSLGPATTMTRGLWN